jgi:hypothetical protein
MKNRTRVVLLFCLSINFLTYAGAQTRPSPAAPEKTPPVTRTNIDETFELNIGERRFTEENFNVSTSVSTDGDSGLDLQIGVGLSASRIDVLMRNIRGNVRFHGTLDRILEILRNRPAPSRPLPR